MAYTERLTATITNNKTAIGNLREENKEMEKRLRSLKNQPKVRWLWLDIIAAPVRPSLSRAIPACIAEPRVEQASPKVYTPPRRVQNRVCSQWASTLPQAKHGAGLGPDAIEHLDHKVCTAVKKHNAIRAEAERKELEMAKLQEQMLGVTVQVRPFCD